jgi:hypothetical protein
VDVTAPGRAPRRDLIDMSILPDGELSTIELLDAAHSAKRAVVALEAAAWSRTDQAGTTNVAVLSRRPQA